MRTRESVNTEGKWKRVSPYTYDCYLRRDIRIDDGNRTELKSAGLFFIINIYHRNGHTRDVPPSWKRSKNEQVCGTRFRDGTEKPSEKLNGVSSRSFFNTTFPRATAIESQQKIYVFSKKKNTILSRYTMVYYIIKNKSWEIFYWNQWI